MVESKTGFVIGRVVIFSLFPFFQTFYIWRRERSGWISSIDRKMIIVIFFLYIYIFIFSCSIRPLFPISAAAHSQKGKKKNSFSPVEIVRLRDFFLFHSFNVPPPSISRFETHNDNFLSPYSSSFGLVSNLSVSPRPVRLNSAFGSDVPLLIEENQDMTHTQ